MVVWTCLESSTSEILLNFPRIVLIRIFPQCIQICYKSQITDWHWIPSTDPSCHKWTLHPPSPMLKITWLVITLDSGQENIFTPFCQFIQITNNLTPHYKKLGELVSTLDIGQEKYFYTFVSIYSNNKYPYTALQEMWYMKNQH